MAQIQFYYYNSQTEYDNNKSKDNNCLYFVKGVGIYRGTNLIADNGTLTSASIVEALSLVSKSVESHETKISANTTAIQGLNQEITGMDTSIAANTANIQKLSGDLTTKISAVNQTIENTEAALDQKISNQGTIVSNNTKNIATNTQSIQNINQGIVTINTNLDKKASSTDLTNLAKTVSANSKSIEGHGASITKLGTDLAENVEKVAGQAQLLVSLNSALGDETNARSQADEALSKRITKNANDITDITGEITDLKNDKLDKSAFNSKVTELNNAISGKASVSTVESLSDTVDKKANTSYVNTELAKKATTDYVNNQLSLKANAKDVEDQLALKAAKSTVETLSGTVNTIKNTTIPGLDGRITANTNALTTLNGGVNQTGSIEYKIDNAVTEAIATIVDGAPDTINTIRELIEVLGGYTPDASGNPVMDLITTVGQIASDLEDLRGDLTTEQSARDFGDKNLDDSIDRVIEDLNDTNASITDLEGKLDTETQNRINADNALDQKIGVNENNISTNAQSIDNINVNLIPALESDIEDIEGTLETHAGLIDTNKDNIAENLIKINTNASSIQDNAAAIATNAQAIRDEASTRASADTELGGRITDLETLHNSHIQNLEDKIEDETQARIDGDKALEEYVDDEVAKLEDADSALSTRIDNNADAISANAADIAELESRIGTLESTVNAMASKLNFIWNNFIVNNTSVASANTKALKLGSAILQFNATDESVDVTFN